MFCVIRADRDSALPVLRGSVLGSHSKLPNPRSNGNFRKPPQSLCRLCRDQFYAFDIARNFGAYNEAPKKAVLLLKFEELTCLGNWFASRLAEVVMREAEQFRADVVVPIPLHADRRRERGYNQLD